jgi:hypothetical protein
LEAGQFGHSPSKIYRVGNTLSVPQSQSGTHVLRFLNGESQYHISGAKNTMRNLIIISTLPGRVLGATARRWRRLTTSLFDPYRPELHYMRGPGPKWRAKHARGAGFAS